MLLVSKMEMDKPMRGRRSCKGCLWADGCSCDIGCEYYTRTNDTATDEKFYVKSLGDAHLEYQTKLEEEDAGSW